MTSFLEVAEEVGRGAAVDGSGEDHAGGGRAVGKKFFDEALELLGGRERDLEQEGVAAGEVVALLDGVKGFEEFEEGLVAGAVAGHADEGGDGEAEGFQVEVGAVAADEAEAFELLDAFGGGGGAEADAAGELGEGEAGVGGEFEEDLFVVRVEFGHLM